jgi:hypothetical protein
VLVTFHHCDKILEKTREEGFTLAQGFRGFFQSMVNWLDHHCGEDIVEGRVEHSCLFHSS